MKTLSISEKQIFFIGLSLKIILGSFFASYFLSSFFIPFVDYFINNLNNPYTFFFENGSEEFFPYPALMLFVLSLPAYFVNIFINLNELPIQISYLIEAADPCRLEYLLRAKTANHTLLWYL